MAIAKLILPLSVALVLAACSSGPGYHTHAKSDTARTSSVQHQHHHHAKRFSCENGLTVSVRHLDNSRVELRMDDKSAVLQAAVSGSGERYTASTGFFGHGAEWHQKGKIAALTFKDPYGNLVETNCNAI